MAEPRFFTGVFCDDIRFEIGNKISLIGIYNADIIIPAKPPIALPKLAVAITVGSDPDDIPKKLVLHLIGPDDKEFFKTEIPNPEENISNPEGAKKIIVRSFAQMPVLLSQGGYIQAMVETERETQRAARLKVSFSPPPEEQKS